VDPRFDCDSFARELLYCGVDVTAHEKKFVTRFSCLSGMDGNFGRRKREDQPTTARVYVMQPKHFFEECSIGLWVMAVDDCVSAINHFISSPQDSEPRVASRTRRSNDASNIVPRYSFASK